MRTIKFKAKTANGEWVIGCLLHRQDGSVYIYDDNNDVPFSGLVCSEEETALRIPVDRKTVCQFTGLLDKNGKEIYEGDVLKGNRSFSSKIFERTFIVYGFIKFVKEQASFLIYDFFLSIDEPRKIVTPCRHTFTQKDMDCYEVAGSIHDKEWKEKLNLKDE